MGNGKSGSSKYLQIGVYNPTQQQVSAAASNSETNTLVYMDYIHDQQHQGRIIKLNVLQSGVLLNAVTAFAWRIGDCQSDMYLDAFSVSGKAEFLIREGVTVPTTIGTNVLMLNMNRNATFNFTLFGTKEPPTAGNSVTQLTAAQYALITGGSVIHHEEIGDKKAPGTPTIQFPIKLAKNTYYVFWYKALAGPITINANILFNQESGASC
jgi:hypothetical protein